jgi:NADH-quinone oxidoreductase subunit L
LNASDPTGAIRVLWLLPLLPLAGFALNTLIGRRLKLLAGWLATLLVFASFAVAVAATLELLTRDASSRLAILRGYDWISSGNLRIAFDLRWDPLSAVMALVVTGVGGLIHLYSIGYMAHDERPGTFFAWLNLFVAAMLTLVLAQNFVVMYLGWEGVGLASYLLIGFWFYRTDVAGFEGNGVPVAAKKAFIANRIGDVGFLLAMFLIFLKAGSLDFDQVFGRAGAAGAGGIAGGTATAVALLLFLACTGKSAQIPLYVWLPDAMAGPTPVSALIHAATMVTAGVFLVARTHVLFQASHAATAVVVVIGALTALLAAVIAIAQDDIKKVLAYSTVSQLGYMFIAVGLGPIGYAVGIFHLVTHAFFKAQLFLGAGSVMHANGDSTDLKEYGGLRRVMPVTFVTTVAAWLAIIGFPLTAGFFSKDQILEAAFSKGGGVALFAYVVGLVTVALTAFYMSRLLFLTFFGQPRWPQGRRPHESGPLLTVPLLLLGLLSLGGGAVLGPSIGSGPLYRFLAPVLGKAGEGAAHPNATALLLTLSAVAMLVGASIAWAYYGSGRVDWLALRQRYAALWQPLNRKLGVDELYEFFTVHLGRALAAVLAVFDTRGIDGAVNGLGEAVRAGAREGRLVQTGLVRTYAVGLLGGAVVLLAVLVLRAS